LTQLFHEEEKLFLILEYFPGTELVLIHATSISEFRAQH
jgi:hypothetical protein